MVPSLIMNSLVMGWLGQARRQVKSRPLYSVPCWLQPLPRKERYPLPSRSARTNGVLRLVEILGQRFHLRLVVNAGRMVPVQLNFAPAGVSSSARRGSAAARRGRMLLRFRGAGQELAGWHDEMHCHRA